ncbi:hypothetical protein [Bacillus thuringiensis]|uniref:hypothetical protein n=1 Tax=Bacillus thuringiensis TaxID=1428 RepID=UPI000BEB5E68|nr:hypothetical protein [Bacillus thuringiensis]PDY26982.1 hypothetical protein COM84_25060 [Bacillus thuringiensis]PGH92608.1 hypothetical protein CN898_26510 [Bacillus thuringiensis]
MLKRFVVSVLTVGFVMTGGLSAYADERNSINNDPNFGMCKDITQNVEANEYIKRCVKIFPNSPLGPIISIPKNFQYDDGVYKGTLYLVSEERSPFSIVADYEGTLKKYN